MNSLTTHETALPAVEFQLAPAGLSVFALLLAQGFCIPALVNVSIRELCCRQLAIGADYLDHQIQTIFLNGQPVDDVDNMLVGDHATLALSAAMPGVAGAILRKQSRYAPLRGDSTGTPIKPGDPGPCRGLVRLKLFNIVARELAAGFLTRGIRVEAQRLQDFLVRQADTILKGRPSITVNGTPTSWEDLLTRRWNQPEILLRVLN